MNDKTNTVLNKFFDQVFDKKPEDIERESIGSLRKIAKNFQLSRSFLKNWLKKYLNEKYGHEKAIKTWKNLWPTSEYMIQEKKIKFLEVIKSQLKKYPDEIEKIESLHNLEKRISISRRTITKWIVSYLTNLYGKQIAKEIYNEIWTSRQQQILITYGRIKSVIEQKEGELITKEVTFNNMHETPSQRYVEVKCKYGHIWQIRINMLLYQSFWCPVCKEPKTQRIMRMFMESIFNVRFPETTLHKAYNISAKEGGRLKFDGYNSRVSVKSKIFRIAFEYDGIQHDLWPNPIHKLKKNSKDNKKMTQRKSIWLLNITHLLLNLKLKMDLIFRLLIVFNRKL